MFSIFPILISSLVAGVKALPHLLLVAAEYYAIYFFFAFVASFLIVFIGARLADKEFKRVWVKSNSVSHATTIG